jgi:GNAT superfamily N-acetyltransferase
MASPTLRRARPSDQPAIAAVVQAGFETYRSFAPAGWEPPDESAHEQAGRDELADERVFAMVAEVDGVAVAHVRWVPAVTPSRDGFVPDVHFRHLFVLEPYWGSGIAVELHAAAVEEMRGRDVETARLYTPADHARARRFYEREGWTLRVDRYFDPKIGFDIVEYALRPAG